MSKQYFSCSMIHFVLWPSFLACLNVASFSVGKLFRKMFSDVNLALATFGTSDGGVVFFQVFR